MQTFSEIWEQDGRWLMGPGLLGDIIEHLRDRAPVAAADPRNPNAIDVSIPLPCVTDEISGEQCSVYCMVPEELQGIFADRCNRILQDWMDEKADDVLRSGLGRQNTALTINFLTSGLASIERERVARDEDPLWVIAAKHFGFSRWATPKPAGMAR